MPLPLENLTGAERIARKCFKLDPGAGNTDAEEPWRTLGKGIAMLYVVLFEKELWLQQQKWTGFEGLNWGLEGLDDVTGQFKGVNAPGTLTYETGVRN